MKSAGSAGKRSRKSSGGGSAHWLDDLRVQLWESAGDGTFTGVSTEAGARTAVLVGDDGALDVAPVLEVGGSQARLTGLGRHPPMMLVRSG